MAEYEGLVIGDLMVVCQMDVGAVPNNNGHKWNPYWVAECVCGALETLDLKEVQTLTKFKCNHKEKT